MLAKVEDAPPNTVTESSETISIVPRFPAEVMPAPSNSVMRAESPTGYELVPVSCTTLLAEVTIREVVVPEATMFRYPVAKTKVEGVRVPAVIVVK